MSKFVDPKDPMFHDEDAARAYFGYPESRVEYRGISS